MKRFQITATWSLIACFAIVSFLPAVASAQSEVSAAALERVTEDIRFLASDECGGRQPGTPGMKLAVEYIVKEYEKAGIMPAYDGSYFQEMEVGNELVPVDGSQSLVFSGADNHEVSFEAGEFVALNNRRGIDISAPLVFVGYGIDAGEEHNYNELAGVDLEGAIAVMLRMEPQQDNPDSVFDGTEVSEFAYVSGKVSALRRAGAAAVIFLNDVASAEEEDALSAPDQFGRTTNRIPFFHITRAKFDELLEVSPLVDAEGNKLNTLADAEALIDKNLEPISQPLEGWSAEMKADFETRKIKTYNIVGVIEGEGPNADETIVIGAHYDHLGEGAYGSRAANRRGEIHNGADDNATGTAAVMELARRFQQRDEKPGRRLVFICFTAEEMGLLGAQHYVENPLHPLESTVAMINFDMIGWLREDRVTLYNWNSSPQWEAVLDGANEDIGFELIKPASGFAGSDHLPFNNREVPNLFIHTGVTDTYHTPDDDFETIDCEGATRVIDYTEHVIDGLTSLDKGLSFGTPRPFRLGVSVRVADEVVTIDSVSEGSIAERAGLMAGDVILMIGEDEVKARRNLTRAINKYKDETVMFKLKRDDAEVNLNVALVDDEG
ncbi:MAG: M20/M25/M40 family metallo-hydrolase [Planctomycetota bacterium]